MPLSFKQGLLLSGLRGLQRLHARVAKASLDSLAVSMTKIADGVSVPANLGLQLTSPAAIVRRRG